jgi:alginate O-acetyltransferase complex protein AlgI
LGRPNLPLLLLGTYAFAWQIYGDFSGYSSIARGSAQLIGFHFMVNFRQPYLAESLQDFWRRWHISLSTWLRDYLYVPLGGNRLGKARTYLNLMLTMLLGGLWHGANWTFVVWGGIHGAGLAVERLITGKKEIGASASLVGGWIRKIIVFHLVCLAWVFFRMPSIHDAWKQLSGITTWQWLPVYGVALRFLAMYVLALLLIDLQLEASNGEYLLASHPLAPRLAIAMALCIFITLVGANQESAFIYFRF